MRIRWLSACKGVDVFRVLRNENREVVLTLLGRISRENLAELKSLISSERNIAAISLDLKDVTLVDEDVVRFLGECETNQIPLVNCPGYIRGWIAGSRTQRSRRKK